MRRFQIVALCALLSACASQAHYSKTGGTEEEYQRQLARCRVVAATAPTSEGFMGAAEVASIRQNCMRAEGWIKDN